MSRIKSGVRVLPLLIAVTLVGTLSGCANYEVNTMRGNIPGYYIRYEMQEADRAVETARKAGKDLSCPAEFKAAEDAKNNAYDVFRACHTEEGAALAKAATMKTNALCPPSVAPAPKAAEPPPAPAPVVKAAEPPPAPPVAPTASLTVIPATVTKGQSANLQWRSQNASRCDIQPGIGQVPPQGVRPITPVDTAAYTISCSGTGGTAISTASIAVISPAPVVVAEAPKAAPSMAVEKFCNKPAIIDIQFDTGKSDIKHKYDAELKSIADFLKEFPKAKVEISGHTDNVGGKIPNEKLSQSRADSVKKYIVDTFGISADRITAKGYGFAKPIADNKTKEGKTKNRRIETNFACE